MSTSRAAGGMAAIFPRPNGSVEPTYDFSWPSRLFL